MENYQMLFPCSSSPSMAHLSAYPVLSNSVEMISSRAISSSFGANNHIGHDHKRTSANGLLDLRTENNHGMISPTDLLDGEISTELINNKSGGSTGTIGKIKKGEKKIRKAKYAFQTRSQVDILDDGYRWRKYGQKAVKNNKFPRSYYRCTHQGCNVKKQVQRLTKDEGIVVTTYEGMHTHPIEKHTDNFEHILNQMQIYTPL